MIEEAFKNQRYKEIFFDESIFPKLVVANSGKVITANNAACSLFGYTLDEFRQITFDQITIPQYLPLDRKYFQELVEGDIDHYHMIKGYFTKSGLNFMADLYVYAVRGDNRELSEIIAVLRPHGAYYGNIWTYIAKNTKVIVRILYTILAGSLILLVKKIFGVDISGLF